MRGEVGQLWMKIEEGAYWLYLVPGKYKGKKKNAKENDFLMFDCPMKNIKKNQI